MREKRTSIVSRLAVVLAISVTMLMAGVVSAFADVGSIAADEDVSYDKNGGVLSSIGVDTSKMPDDYDADSKENPYGSNVTVLEKVSELALFNMGESTANSQVYGYQHKLGESFSDFKKNPTTKLIDGNDTIKQNGMIATAEVDTDGDGRTESLAIVYSNHNMENGHNDQTGIYWLLYDPIHGKFSEPRLLTNFYSDRGGRNLEIQSQLQITAGDYTTQSHLF